MLQLLSLRLKLSFQAPIPQAYRLEYINFMCLNRTNKNLTLLGFEVGMRTEVFLSIFIPISSDCRFYLEGYTHLPTGSHYSVLEDGLQNLRTQAKKNANNN